MRGLDDGNQRSLILAVNLLTMSSIMFVWFVAVIRRRVLTSNTYFDWMLDHAFLFVPAQAFVAEHLQTLVEFPPRQEPASFSIDKLLAKLEAGMTSS